MKEQKKEYQQKGVIVIPNVFTQEECDEMKRQAYSVQDFEIKKFGIFRRDIIK